MVAGMGVCWVTGALEACTCVWIAAATSVKMAVEIPDVGSTVLENGKVQALIQNKLIALTAIEMARRKRSVNIFLLTFSQLTFPLAKGATSGLDTHLG